MEHTERLAEEPPAESDQPVASYGLLYITRAYNRKEITLDEWLRQSKEWAESVIQKYGKEQSHDKR